MSERIYGSYWASVEEEKSAYNGTLKIPIMAKTKNVKFMSNNQVP